MKGEHSEGCAFPFPSTEVFYSYDTTVDYYGFYDLAYSYDPCPVLWYYDGVLPHEYEAEAPENLMMSSPPEGMEEMSPFSVLAARVVRVA